MPIYLGVLLAKYNTRVVEFGLLTSAYRSLGSAAPFGIEGASAIVLRDRAQRIWFWRFGTRA